VGDVVSRFKNLRLLRPFLGYIYDRRFENNRDSNLFRGVFNSAAEAAASAPQTRPLGYDQPAAAAMYRDFIDRVALSDYPVLYWMQRLAGGVQSVLDYGGHVGIKYYAYAPFLRWPDGSSWTVCDLPAMVRAGRELSEERRTQNLRFVTDFAEVNGKDLLLCSGSLQYMEEPLATQLGRVAQRPPHVILNVTPLSDGPTFFTLNSIGTAFCPYKVQNFAELVSQMGTVGYELVDHWTVDSKMCIVPLHPERSLHAYTGMYLRAKQL